MDSGHAYEPLILLVLFFCVKTRGRHQRYLHLHHHQWIESAVIVSANKDSQLILTVSIRSSTSSSEPVEEGVEAGVVKYYAVVVVIDEDVVVVATEAD